MTKLLNKYTNGNYTVKIYDNGTKVRVSKSGNFTAEFPENIDIKISNRCDLNCPYCHEGSVTDGDNAHFNHAFLDTLRPGTELAIGGGNVFANPDFEQFLFDNKTRGLISNITVSQIHFNENIDKIKQYMDAKLIYGVGVSIVDSELFSFGDLTEQQKQNIVFHVICGLVDFTTLEELSKKHDKILFLGYKSLRRGVEFYNERFDSVNYGIDLLADKLEQVFYLFKTVSFDNLALAQLDVKKYITDNDWDKYYMGDDGNFTMYIDLVASEFALSSTSLVRYKLLDNIVDMFNLV
jgi:hypothetical protein